jgi:hypothetical protein
MIRLQVEAERVWGWYPKTRGINRELSNYISLNGWSSIPSVPVFRIPDFEDLIRVHEFVLIDGNQRRDIAELRRDKLNIVVYEKGEEIDFKRDGLAESRNLVNPTRWKIAMALYLLYRNGSKETLDKTIIP